MVPPGASNFGVGGLAEVSSEVVLGLGGGWVDGGALAEESSDHVFLGGPFLGGDSLEGADQEFAAVVDVHVGDGVEVGVDFGESLGGVSRPLVPVVYKC